MHVKAVAFVLFWMISGVAADAGGVVPYGRGNRLSDEVFLTLAAGQNYDCRNVGCKKLRSCEEACYKLLVCGQTRRDGDHDGIPCENFCSRRCPRN